uniref:Uncharacterized protein n=2 Tax=Ixodes scapularis TaxID=6945 RepID=A0A1S4M3K8_IXOSC
AIKNERPEDQRKKKKKKERRLKARALKQNPIRRRTKILGREIRVMNERFKKKKEKKTGNENNRHRRASVTIDAMIVRKRKGKKK